MKQIHFGFFLFVVLTGLMAPAAVQAQQRISYEEMVRLRKQQPGQILDVRADWEYRQGHLPCAQLVDVNADDFATKIRQLDKSQPYYVYCYAGGRSAEASQIMTKAGFKQVYNVSEGISGFQKKKIPLTAGDKACP
ncbi:MAG: rhodanese-like domain-containing protein [Bacteroidetes bacterium]|jgi:rhodanese-related sulfurtransferase|nr:rhodanese-like domain-containing protein [Bacteroidota bacterium]